MSKKDARAFVKAAHLDNALRAAIQRYGMTHDVDALIGFANEREYHFNKPEINKAIAHYWETPHLPPKSAAGVDPDTIDYFLHPANHDYVMGTRRIPILRHTGLAARERLTLVVILGVIALFSGMVFYGSYVKYVRLRDSGTITEGIVTRHNKILVSNGRYSYYDYYVTFRFTHRGFEKTHEQKVSQDTYEALKDNQRVQIRVDPTDSSLAVVEGTNSVRKDYLAGAVGFGLAGLFVMGQTLVMNRRNAVYAKHGDVVMGGILRSMEVVNKGRQSSYVVKIELAFCTLNSSRERIQMIDCRFTNIKMHLPPNNGKVAILYVDDAHWWLL